MATSNILLFILLLIGDVITQNDWALKDATSVVCVPYNLKLDFFVLSANKNTIKIRKEDSFGTETISTYYFNSKFEDLNVNMYLERENSTYTFFIFYDNHLQIINENYKINDKYPIKPGYFRNTLKKLNNNFFYIATDLSLVKLNLEKISNNYRVSYTTKTIFNNNLAINSISCDSSKDKKYYICSYFVNEDIGISLFSNDTSLLIEKKFKAGIKEPKNYFNKIFFLKDNYKIISINSQNNNEIRFRHLEIIEDDLKIIQLYEKQKQKVDYLDIKGTQADSSYLYNDIVSLDNDEMIKVYMKNNELWISKIQFYYDKYMLTIKTKKYYDSNYKANIIHLTRRNNGIVIDYANGNNINFIQIGHVKTSTKQVSDEYFSIDNFEIDSLFKTKVIVEIESIPDNFTFLRTFENTIVDMDKMVYPEDERFQIVRYRTTKEFESLKFQTKLLYEFPPDSEFQMFPIDETETSPETKILSSGNEGLIYFKLISCFNNYYKIENSDICTLIRPEGYYLNHYTNVYSKCYENCAECITFSNDHKNMQCLKCKDGHYYEEEIYNCIKFETVLPQNVNIELASNDFFWVFLAIILIGAILAFFIILYDKICCVKKSDEEIIGEITEKMELNPLYRDSNNNSIN